MKKKCNLYKKKNKKYIQIKLNYKRQLSCASQCFLNDFLFITFSR